MKKVILIVRKEWTEVIRNRLLLFSVFLVPVLLVAIPLLMLYLMGTEEVPAEEVEMYYRVAPQLAGLAPNEVMQVITVSQFLFMFLMMPLFIPITIASFTIIGEKQQRSLEPLLATPITVGELLLGKSLAAAIPAVLTTWLAFGIFALGARFLTTPPVRLLLVNSMWLLAMLIIAPLCCLLSVALAVIVSSRVNDVRVAEQIAGFIVIPLVGFSLLQVAGKVFYTTRAFVIASVVLALLDAIALYLGVRLFQREEILTRWR